MLVSVFSEVLLISIMASVLILLILLVKTVFKEKLSAGWHYYIWLLLLLRLAIPYTPEFSLNLNGFAPAVQDTVGIQAENSTNDRKDNNLDFRIDDKTATKSTGYNANNNLTTAEKNKTTEKLENNESENSKLLSFVISSASKIWLLGIIFFIFYFLIINHIMSRRIHKSSKSEENGSIEVIFDYCKKLLNIKKDIPILYQKHIKTPAVYGIINPKILIPADIFEQLGPEEIKYVFLHELCHFRHKDTVIGLIKMLLCVPHWFNPLVWYAFKKMKEDREPVCDEIVLSSIKPDERRNYAETLIKTIKYYSENHTLYNTASMSQGNINNIKWRLKLINILKKRSVILGIVIALATITIGTAGVLFINNHLSFALPANASELYTPGPADEVSDTAIKDEPAGRGKILDRNGMELAVSIPADIIALNPTEIKATGQDTDSIAEALANYLSLGKIEMLEKLKSTSSYEIVKRKVDKDTGSKIKEWVENNSIKGVIIDEDSKRVYPNGNLAANVIGFTGEDAQGLAGIELSMEEYLKPEGTEVTVDGNKKLEGGSNVMLTIDLKIQRIVENTLDKAINDYKVINGATALIMDPKSGEILAMASKSNSDPNAPYSPDNVSDTFQPGSVFKPITAAMALEEGIISPDSKVNDSPISINGSAIHCWRTGRLHGEDSFEEAVYNSCDPVFVRLAQNLGTDKYYSYVKNFGFYDKTGLELPGEAQGNISENPAELDMAMASIGQKFQVTPLQLASAYSAIANGGNLMKPQIIKKLTGFYDNDETIMDPRQIRNVISKGTADSMKAMLEDSVSKGTAANAYAEGYKIAGCVGTSEKSTGKYIASFAGFAPANEPEIVCIIILDEPTIASQLAGATAAPVAGEVIKEVLDYMSEGKK